MRNHKLRLIFLIFAVFGLAAYANTVVPDKDGSWVQLSGKVTHTSDDSFMLKYGSNQIQVEMDDWDWYPEGRLLLKGDQVTVHGRVDNDLFETKSIEASSVYVKGLNTFYYADSADEESWRYPLLALPPDGSWIEVNGIVKEINGREFTLNTGWKTLAIDTTHLGYNPLDNKGPQKVEKGDYVRVSGSVDDNVFKQKEIIASSIITLVKDSRSSKKD